MVHFSLTQSFFVLVPNLAVSLQSASPLSPHFSPPPQHLAGLQPTIILALMIVYFLIYKLRHIDSDDIHYLHILR